MKLSGNKYRRALYAYEFDNGAVYVGLTYNYKKRHLQHLRRGRVFKELKKSSFKYIKLNNWMSAEEAQKEEVSLIEKYRAEGWRVLNQVKGGALGGSTIIWTDEALKQEALKFQTIYDFREKSPSAYTTASLRGFNKVCPLYVVRTFWTSSRLI